MESDGPRQLHHRHSRDSHESAVGRMKQLADLGQSDSTASELIDKATFRERADASVRCTGLGAD